MLIFFTSEHNVAVYLNILFFFCICHEVFFTFVTVTYFLLTFQIIQIMKIVLLNSWTGAPLH